MIELKDFREQQEKLVTRVKDLNGKVSLAVSGAADKLKVGSNDVVEKFATLGKEAFGDKAEGKSRAILAVRGLADNAKSLDVKALLESAKGFYAELPAKTKALYEQVVEAGRNERGELAEKTNEFALAGFGAVATLREKGKSVFNDLVDAAGKKQG